MPRIVLLCVGKDEMLLQTRAAVLRHAGYVVRVNSSPKRAIADFYDGDFDLVILCHSLSVEDRQRLEDAIHRRSPGTPVVWVEGVRPLDGALSSPTVEGEPQKLLAGLSELIAQYALGRRINRRSEFDKA